MSVSTDAKWLSAYMASNDKTAYSNLENLIYIMDLKYNITSNNVATHNSLWFWAIFCFSKAQNKVKFLCNQQSN